MLPTLRRLALVLFLGVCSFAGGGAALLLAPYLSLPTASAQPAPPAGRPANHDLLRISDQFEAVARKVSPAVVAVDATKPPAANGRKATEESGSGVLVRFDGKSGIYVLTNNHVIANAPPAQITVSLADARVLRPAQVWTDPESDIAVLRLDNADNAPTAPLGDSDAMRVGQWVVAIGSPFGLNQTVTHGILSARERGEISLGSTIRIKNFLQTDAAINPGSSGGPLLNLDGEVIGINTAIASNSGASSGVAFSIPINLVKRVAGQLLERGSVARGYLGMQLAPTFEATDALRLGLERAQGARIEAVYPDTPAAAAGLRVNDVVLQVDETVIRSETHLINVITGTPAGQKVRLKVWRDRRTVTVDAVVGDWSRGQSRFRAP